MPPLAAFASSEPHFGRTIHFLGRACSRPQCANKREGSAAVTIARLSFLDRLIVSIARDATTCATARRRLFNERTSTLAEGARRFFARNCSNELAKILVRSCLGRVSARRLSVRLQGRGRRRKVRRTHQLAVKGRLDRAGQVHAGAQLRERSSRARRHLASRLPIIRCCGKRSNSSYCQSAFRFEPDHEGQLCARTGRSITSHCVSGLCC